jgi:hypothetical protein
LRQQRSNSYSSCNSYFAAGNGNEMKIETEMFVA